MSNKRKIALIVFILFSLTLLFFWYFIFDIASMSNDGAHLWYPLLSFSIDSIHNRQLPLWNPFDLSGRPCIGDTVYGVFYPLFWPLVFFVKGHILSFLAMEYVAIFHVFLTGLFMFLFGRVLNLSICSSLISAIIFMFSGSSYALFDCFPMAHLTWFPFILLFLQKSLDSRDYKYAVFAGVGLGLAGLYFNPQFYLYIVYGIGFYSVYDLWQKKRSGGNKQELFLSVRLFLIFVIIGLALAAVQIIPTFELALNSPRAKITWSQSVYNSMHPRRLIGFFIPYFFVEPSRGIEDPGFEEYHMYIGILPLILSGIGAFLGKHPKRKFFILLFLISLIYCLGKYAPVQPIFFHLLPGFDKVRGPTRAIWVCDFALAILSGIGINSLLESQKNELKDRIDVFCKKLLKAGVIFLSLAVLATLLWIIWLIDADFSKIRDLASTRIFGYTYFFLLFFFSALGLLRLFLKNKIKRSLFKALVLLLVTLDLFVIQTQLHSYKRVASNKRYPSVNRVLFLKQDPDLFRVLTDYGDYDRRDPVLKNDWGSFYRLFNAWGYAPIILRNLQDLSVIHNENLLFLLNIKYIITKENSFPGADLVFTEDDLHTFRLKNYLARIYFVKDYKIIEDRDEALRFISGPEFNPRETIVLNEEPVNIPGDAAIEKTSELSSVTIEKYANNFIDVSVVSGSNGFLSFSELYYPGWNSYVDGLKEKIYRANYAFRAVYLKKGLHHVHMVYEPLSFYAGLTITLASVIFLIGYFFFYGFRVFLTHKRLNQKRKG